MDGKIACHILRCSKPVDAALAELLYLLALSLMVEKKDLQMWDFGLAGKASVGVNPAMLTDPSVMDVAFMANLGGGLVTFTAEFVVARDCLGAYQDGVWQEHEGAIVRLVH